MECVRIGLIGCGVMARHHLGYLDKLDGVKLTAVSDVVAASLQKVVDDTGAAGFDDAQVMMDSGKVDAVLIATPHKFHPTLAMAGFDRGLHVLTEKPVAITAGEAAAINAAHAKHPKLVYAAMFQERTRPVYKYVKQLLENGRIGKMLRMQWTVTTWMRNQAYYDQGSWRATWAGEGGGVLLNQCPHNLDMIYWLTGLPQQVIADVGIAKHHNIEVEDEVNALLRYEDGATGVFITNTAEAPGTNRLEIVGDLGTVIIEPNDVNKPVIFRELTGSARHHIDHAPTPQTGLPCHEHTITPAPLPNGHEVLAQNFINAIRHGEPLVAPGEEGLYSLELSNAMVMSGLNDSRAVDLPTDHGAYARLLKQLVEGAEAKV